jgi:L,D-transpeptidase YcbB
MPMDSMDIAYRNLAVKPVRRFYEGREERLFWISGFNRSARGDSLIAFIGKVRYFGLLPDEYHVVEIDVLKDKLSSVESVCRLEALLTDAYIAMFRHITFGKSMRLAVLADSLAVSSLERYTEVGGLDDNITFREPSFPGYRSLKYGLGQLLDSLPPDQRDAALLNSSMALDDVRKRIETIEVNLERWRSEKHSFGSRYILINIAAFMLYLVENDSVILESKVIVGTSETPTPVLSSTIECFITYPYWHVPRKISIEEYLPLIQQDTSFLRRNNFDVLDNKGNALQPNSLDWRGFSKNYFPVLLRQREGEENALGIIKFSFDNPYAVFLHDTNAKRLFKSKVRAFSHGCIRMEKAVDLAHYLITGDLNKRSKYLERFLKEESQHWVELQRPIPIFVRYYTCVLENGRLRYHNDIYQRDRVISGRLYMSIDKTDLEISNDYQ